MSFDEAFCNREYNNRLAIPEHPGIFQRWKTEAATARRRLGCLLDLPYGDSSGERLDLFPAAADGAPLLVFIHGGYWRSMDKSDFSWVASDYVAHGVSVAIVNYDLCPMVSVEDIVRQMLRAFAWLYRSAELYGYDRERIVASGHSAGGHLTAMMMAAQWSRYGEGLPNDLIHGGFALSGLFDLEPLKYATFLHPDVKLDDRDVERLSPAWMPTATHAPLVTSVGTLESSEFKRQSALIAKRWRANFRRDIPAVGCNHLTICDEFANPTSPLFRAALDLCEAR